MYYISPMALKPVPKMRPNITSRRRIKMGAENLTSTPIKDEQRKKFTKKQKADADKEKRVIKNLKSKLSEKAGSSGMQKRPKSRTNTKDKETESKYAQKGSNKAANENYI
ncbi:unnamed protein product [Euphydryas editha]|uniref:Uncharacterized protein n=1 Tax=Euphydryas editha TaxID=104508 RepID=A0AAU9TRZ7_EUPED|nr:unnamed protein product [Euphydryas editha]